MEQLFNEVISMLENLREVEGVSEAKKKAVASAISATQEARRLADVADNFVD